MTESYAPIVVATATIGDGLVLRWYRSEAAADAHREIVSASRNGIAVDGRHDADDIERLADVLRDAAFAARLLTRGQDVHHMATHRRDFRSGALTAVSS